MIYAEQRGIKCYVMQKAQREASKPKQTFVIIRSIPTKLERFLPRCQIITFLQWTNTTEVYDFRLYRECGWCSHRAPMGCIPLCTWHDLLTQQIFCCPSGGRLFRGANWVMGPVVLISPLLSIPLHAASTLSPQTAPTLPVAERRFQLQLELRSGSSSAVEDPCDEFFNSAAHNAQAVCGSCWNAPYLI